MEFRMRFTLLMLCCSYVAVATAQVTEMPGWATQTSAGKPELCFLPPDEGTNEDGLFMIYLYYDAVKDKCYPFKYFGSGGNANCFVSERDCIRNCSANANALYPSPESKACHLPKTSGECFGQYLRYYYDAQQKRCRKFIWTGCVGNGNRFLDELSCNSTCHGIEGQEPEPCDHYTVLNDTWRATTNQDQSDLKCDQHVQWRGWYRMFYQGQSVRMPDSCVPEGHCGTNAPLWLNGTHPRQEDGIVTREVCGSWTNGCCHFASTYIRVKMCPGNYAVYELVRPSTCHLAYCADVSSAQPTPAPTTPITNPPCGDLSSSGSFSSPYYPNYYHDNAYCVWRLSAPPGQRVLLLFTDLELEGCCDCDYISVYDGPSTSSSQLGRLCANSTADAFHSSSNHMTVLFRSDSSLVSRGFRAEFISSLSPSKGNVECSRSHMTITISLSFLSSEGFHGDDLYVNDPNCRPTQNSSQVTFRFHLKQCGTSRKIQNGWVVYANDVRTYPNDTQDITYLPQLHLSVGCHMEKDAVSQVMYVAHNRLEFNVTGTGLFNTSMAFYTSSNFYDQVHADPYYVSLGDYMYVQVRLGEPDSSLVVFLDTCVASPTPDDDQHQHSHYLLLNGCPADSTYYSYTSGSNYYARFHFRAFTFLRTYPSVYLRCKVVICASGDPGSRCRQGCRSRRVARQLDPQLDTTTMVLGPIKFRDPEQLEDLVAKADA
ncbi:deleted in malignant brain tumors 1 protein-like [Engraulis encrasicolus]|uniref:deleted in malignant brain tumors 1 protein-like n=1 Tax=Engraulis encrasicolus TaxID=184585 RepID=UPI002FD01B72